LEKLIIIGFKFFIWHGANAMALPFEFNRFNEGLKELPDIRMLMLT